MRICFRVSCAIDQRQFSNDLLIKKKVRDQKHPVNSLINLNAKRKKKKKNIYIYLTKPNTRQTKLFVWIDVSSVDVSREGKIKHEHRSSINCRHKFIQNIFFTIFIKILNFLKLSHNIKLCFIRSGHQWQHEWFIFVYFLKLILNLNINKYFFST